MLKYREKLVQNGLIWRRGVLVMTAAQLHSRKPGLRFCASLNPAHGLLEICDGEKFDIGPGWK